MSDIKWATIIPLIGGSAVGCSQATGNKPQYHLSYKAFGDNEKHIQNYWPDVPRISLDEGGVIPEGDIDFVNSVCPCAGLSQLNTSRSTETRDEKNKWMFESAEVVLGKVKPKVFFGENAPGLFTNSGKYVLDGLNDMAKKHNYSFSVYRTNTQLHGIPQRRVRTFYFFWRDTDCPTLGFYNRETLPLHEYLKQIPAEASHQDQYNFPNITDEYKSYIFMLNKLGQEHHEFVKTHDTGAIHSVYTYLAENGLLDECLAFLRENYPGIKEIRRLESIKAKTEAGGRFMDGSPGYYYTRSNALVGRTLTHLMHPTEMRGISLREAMHLMGLPHDFPFTNSKDLNHLAQNVPTCTARDMASEVVKYLNGELVDSGKRFLMQDNLRGGEE
jgi:DNA (cytosine-5)-methyltransferase 1